MINDVTNKDVFLEPVHRFQCDTGCRAELGGQSRTSQDVSDAMEPRGYTCKLHSPTNRLKHDRSASANGCSDI